MSLVGGVEAGGTKFVCAVGTGPETLRARTEFLTTSPRDTIGRVIAFFEEQRKHEPLSAVGIASFGPIDVNLLSPRWGYITSTPKPGWQDVDLAGPIGRCLNLPVAFDTDVNVAALGEREWGAAQGLDTFV
jgi:fructokinase